MNEERIDMLKQMIEQSVNPVGWLGYHKGHLVSFLQTQEQLNSFLKNTEPTGKVVPVYTHSNEDRDSAIYATGYWKGIEYKRMRELTDEEVSEFINQMVLCCQVHPNSANINVLGLAQIVKDILKKASEK